jgi:hypothetical protein
MSDAKEKPRGLPKSEPEEEPKGPNLILLYALLALALLTAAAFAAMIVWPFYLRK